MPFRSSATAFSNTGGNLTATPSGVVAKDILLGFFVQEWITNPTAAPSGWSVRLAQEQAGPENQTFDLYDKVAAGGDSFTTVGAGAESNQWTVGAWSGRDTAAPRTDVQGAQKNTTTATPITISTAGATSGTVGVASVAGDDIAVFAQLDQQASADVWGFNNDLSGYTERQDSNNNWITSCLYTKDGVAGGGDSSLSFTATRSTGSSNAGWGTIVVALKVGSNLPTARSRAPKVSRHDEKASAFTSLLDVRNWFRQAAA